MLKIKIVKETPNGKYLVDEEHRVFSKTNWDNAKGKGLIKKDGRSPSIFFIEEGRLFHDPSSGALMIKHRDVE